ncbi:unnamed protein product [Calypogeia fissa]
MAEANDSLQEGCLLEEESISWKEEEFYYPPEYWTQTCGLPDGGIAPSQLSEEHITNDQLESVFGKKSGRNGFPITNSKEIAKDDIVKLTQVLDGHDYPVNGMLGIQLVRGLYWERIKGEKVNWAAFAVDKHKGQIGKARRQKDSRPTGPPIVRIDRHYVSWAPIKPPPPPMSDYIPRPLTFLNSPLDGMLGKPDQESTLYGIKPTASTYLAPDPTHTTTALSHLIASSLEDKETLSTIERLETILNAMNAKLVEMHTNVETQKRKSTESSSSKALASQKLSIAETEGQHARKSLVD